jgi:hypothetical protein
MDIYVALSKQARRRANARLGLTLPWTPAAPSVARHASGGVALVTPAQYAQIQHLPGVRRLRDPWPHTGQQTLF